MAYEPTEWVTGDVITEEKLNKAENGIAANSRMVYTASATFDQGSYVTTDLFSDAIAAAEARRVVILNIDEDDGSGIHQYYMVSYTDTDIYFASMIYYSGAETPVMKVWNSESGIGDNLS